MIIIQKNFSINKFKVHFISKLLFTIIQLFIKLLKNNCNIRVLLKKKLLKNFLKLFFKVK